MRSWQANRYGKGVDEIKASPLYFTRTRGLFRECYPGQKTDAPNGKKVELYMSPVETWCRNLDYYIPDEDGKTNNLNTEQMTRIRKFTRSLSYLAQC